ncbi:unnamed protein product, partial [marine sediment metagenome]
GYFDAEFEYWSKKLIENFRNQDIILYVSNITEAEILYAPNKVKKLYFELLDLKCKILIENEESVSLAKKYIENQILTPNYLNDARHISIATINNLDVLVSWNFKHIVHYDKIRKFNLINIREGYKLIDIYSPMEVVYE